MSPAIFILTINVFTAFVFSACFGVAHMRKRPNRGENLLALAYGLIAIHGLLELVQPLLAAAEPGNFIVFVVYLGAMTALVAGMARRFAIATPPIWLLCLIAIGGAVYWGLLGLDRQDPVRPLLYQAPFVGVQLFGCWVVWRSRRSQINSLLLTAFAASAVIFASKPFLAGALGIGRDTQSFLGSDYGAFSQMFEAFFLISTGVLLMIAMAGDLLAEITLRSETDKLSGLLNRRGFEERCDRVIGGVAYSDDPIVLILADLDHFKDVNDSFGHAAGDRVIAAFARVLRDSARAANEVFVGRLGGEEFGVLLSGNLIEGRSYSERARNAFATLQFDGIAPHAPFTASFGIAEHQLGEVMPKLMARADSALYEAKRGGRNRAHIAQDWSVVQGEGGIALERAAGGRHPDSDRQ